MKRPADIVLTTRILRENEIIAESLEGETVMVSLENNKYYGLNRIGSRVWEIIAHPITIAELCATLLDEFNVDANTCQREVLTLAQKLADEKLIQIHPDN